MPTLYDARGNEILAGFPDAVNGSVLINPRTYTSVLSAVNAEVIMDLNGAAVATFDVRTAAGALSFVFEGTMDGVNYVQLPGFINFQSLNAVLTAEQYVGTVTFAAAVTNIGQYIVGVTGFNRVRLRVSAFTSGNITVAARASIADFIIYGRQIPSTLHVTVTATVGVIATLTLPSAGVGLFHYITLIQLVQFVSVARTAAATPVLATTTNLPGSPVYSLDATVGAVGQLFLYDFTPLTPLKSLLAATATTFVGPATASTIWRWNVSYYVGA